MKMNILDLHEQFCQDCRLIKNYAKSTIRWFRSTIKAYQKHAGDVVNLEDVSVDTIRDFLYHGRLERNWTPDTFLHYHKGLKSFFTWCVKRGLIEKNPLDEIEKPRLEKKLPKRISKQDALKVLDWAFHKKWTYRYERYRNRAVLGIMIYAGLRAREALNLGMNDIDLENSVISVVSGKGGKDRVVPICSALRVILKEYLKDRERLHKDSIHFFTTLQGNGAFTYTGLTRVVSKIRKKSGVKFSSHKLRHTFATMMLEGGCDIFTLSKMLGHSDIKTTTIYLSASVAHMQEQIMKHPLN